MYRDKSAKREWRWRLIADDVKKSNIANSGEGYGNKADCLNGLNAVKRGAPDAEVVETDG